MCEKCVNNRSIGYIKSKNKKWTKTGQRFYILETQSDTQKSFLLIFDKIIILLYKYANRDLFFYSRNMNPPLDTLSSEIPGKYPIPG